MNIKLVLSPLFHHVPTSRYQKMLLKIKIISSFRNTIQNRNFLHSTCLKCLNQRAVKLQIDKQKYCLTKLYAKPMLPTIPLDLSAQRVISIVVQSHYDQIKESYPICFFFIYKFECQWRFFSVPHPSIVFITSIMIIIVSVFHVVRLYCHR